MKIIDLRSDTVTRPTPAMKEAMAAAPLGDDVFGEDETVNRLEQQVAKRLGKEAALFVPSGTMSNQIGLKVHTQPGDEFYCERDAHINQYEGGAPAILSGLTTRTLQGERGILSRASFEGVLRPDDPHFCRPRLVCLENTSNRGGGSIYPIETIAETCGWAREHGLATHLDGARLWNASVAAGVSLAEYAKHFDTISVCFSKGLGAPVGSALVGPGNLIAKGRRFRKVLGGGMRQAGVIAAAALYALEHHIDRLAEDHANARILVEALEATPGFEVRADEIETNLIWIPVAASLGSARQVAARFEERGVRVIVGGPQLLRMCTHLDVSTEECRYVAEVVSSFAAVAS